MDQAGNVDEYSMDDKSIVKMRKYYGHKKDRTMRAPKENKLTTNSTIDNETRLMILSVGNDWMIEWLNDWLIEWLIEWLNDYIDV